MRLYKNISSQNSLVKQSISLSAYRATCDLAAVRVQAQMAESEETRPILEALRADRSTARERQSAMERQIKAEARRLRSGGDARASWLYLHTQLAP